MRALLDQVGRQQLGMATSLQHLKLRLAFQTASAELCGAEQGGAAAQVARASR